MKKEKLEQEIFELAMSNIANDYKAEMSQLKLLLLWDMCKNFSKNDFVDICRITLENCSFIPQVSNFYSAIKDFELRKMLKECNDIPFCEK